MKETGFTEKEKDSAKGLIFLSPALLSALAVFCFAALAEPLFSESLGWLLSDSHELILSGDILDSPAPAFKLQDRDGNEIALTDLRGKTVFLHFWASWCPSCLEEMPSISRLARMMQNRDFVVIAASADFEWSAIDAVTGEDPFLRTVMDENSETARRYGTFMYPETYVIDGQGRLRAVFRGPRKWDSTEAIGYFENMTR